MKRITKKTEIMKNQELQTIYFKSPFGITQIEGKVLDFGTRKYAQYDNAIFVNFVPKGKRSANGFVEGYRPYVLILQGINHPAPADPFKKLDDEGSRITRMSSFDEGYQLEFDEKMKDYLKDQKILMDVRFTVNSNIINK